LLATLLVNPYQKVSGQSYNLPAQNIYRSHLQVGVKRIGEWVREVEELYISTVKPLAGQA
jgi:hypothetical protein